MERLVILIMKWITAIILIVRELPIILFKKNWLHVTLDGEEIVMNDKINIDELAEALADLTIEVKILEAKVQRLSEFRDTLGHVPLYEKGGKQ